MDGRAQVFEAEILIILVVERKQLGRDIIQQDDIDEIEELVQGKVVDIQI